VNWSELDFLEAQHCQHHVTFGHKLSAASPTFLFCQSPLDFRHDKVVYNAQSTQVLWKYENPLCPCRRCSKSQEQTLCSVSPGIRYYLRVNKCSDAEHNICVRCCGEGVKRSNIEHNAATIITCLSDHLADNAAPSVRQSANYSQSSLAN